VTPIEIQDAERTGWCSRLLKKNGRWLYFAVKIGCFIKILRM